MFCFCSKLQEQNKTEVSSQKIKFKKKSLVTFFTFKVEKCSDSPRFTVLTNNIKRQVNAFEIFNLFLQNI